MSTIMTASDQWATRPDDQRFASLLDLQAHTSHGRANSRASRVRSNSLTFLPVEGSTQGLVVENQAGNTAEVTNWAFSQACQRAGAPSGYLRTLPGAMAADCVNFGLKVNREVEDVAILAYKNGGPAELRAMTGPEYGRIWNSDIVDTLVDKFGDGINGDFRVPGEFGKRVEVTKANTTLYASDRDMFVFLADEDRRVTVPNRRDGESGELARGFFVWNSEVGSTSFGIATFLFDYVCCNRIVWGATEYKEIRVRHTSKAPDRFLREVTPTLLAYSRASTQPIEDAIAAAQKAKVDKVEAFLRDRKFSGTQARAIMGAHMADEGRPIETLWDVSTGITAYARGVSYQDERVALERTAGAVLDLATA
jgi:uncharacterized protein DUF932